jgi:hypothetical protein
VPGSSHLTKEQTVQSTQNRYVKFTDPTTARDVLAVVVSQGYDCFFVRPKGRKGNALLKMQAVFDAFHVHDLRFSDVVVVDVETINGKDVVTALRAPTDEEFEQR